jgi:hypothetical protein
MADTVILSPSLDEFVEDGLRRFAENPENRDRATLMILWHLERLAHIGDAVNRAIPSISGMLNSPMGKILGR